jgi:hypothetical protein
MEIELLTSHRTAKLAQEKNFNIDCEYCYYDKEDSNKIIEIEHLSFAAFSYKGSNWKVIPTPTKEVLKRWLINNHGIEVLAYCNASGWLWEINKAFSKDSFSGGTNINWSNYSGPNDSGGWDEYDDAFDDGLYEALKLI